jgi:hypothetical protein
VLSALIALLLVVIPGQVRGEIFFHQRWESGGRGAANGYGISASGEGDYDADGQHDVVIGAYREEVGGAVTGAAYLYFGGHSPDRLFFHGTEDRESFGYTVACAGDYNGDGYDDLMISAPDWEAGGAQAGRVFMYYGGSSMDTEPDLVFTLSSGLARFGTSAAGIGDIDLDGFDDILIGAPYASNFRGYFALYRGAPVPDTEPDLIVANEVVHLGRLGFSAANVGDVNSDGRDDFAVSMVPKRLQAGSDDRVGEVWLYYGGLGLPASPEAVYHGLSNQQLFGLRVSGAGDFNGDGFDDVAVGAPQLNSPPPLKDPPYENGAVFLYEGGTAPDTAAALVLFGENVRDGFGSSICPAGDVDGDGFPDILIGAPENDQNGDRAGACYVYHGNDAFEARLAAKLPGREAGGQFGYCVSSANRVGARRLNFIVGASGAHSGFLYESLLVFPPSRRR